MTIINDCALCKAIEDSIKNKDDANIFNTPLKETKSFVVMPCIGPLFMGHILIVSKGHYESLASMNANHIKEFENILEEVLGNGKLYKNALVTEHGSFNKQKGGSCIEHTHIHVIPEIGNLYEILDEVLPKKRINSISAIGEIEEPYIFNYKNKKELVYYTAYNVQSQMMRLAICNHLNRKDSHWTFDERKDLVIETIKYWNNTNG